MAELIKILTPDFEFSDERGFLCQLVHEGYSQVNLVRSIGGAERGGHFHRLNNEAFYVVEGSFTVRVTLDGETESRTFRKGDMFLIPKGVSHSFFYLEDTTLVGLYDRGVELLEGGKDIISSEEK